MKRFVDVLAWGFSIGLHAWILSQVLFHGAAEEQEVADPVGVAFQVVALVEAEAATVPEEEEAEEPPEALEIRPPAAEEVGFEAELVEEWSSEAESPPESAQEEPGEETPSSSSDAGQQSQTEDGPQREPADTGWAWNDAAIEALPLTLDLQDREDFLAGARHLGLRFLVYPPVRPATWLIDVPGCRPDEAVLLDPDATNRWSARGHDLTPDPYFRRIRNQAAERVGRSPVGARIVAAVPAGLDRLFLEKERSYLEGLGVRGEQVRELTARFIPAGEDWTLEITGGR
ncbi:MAG: hypothetical protein H8E31_07750 [Planctomycetes bacterium]|nr:hypothetical protein [Planctomycetota bacterium]